MTEPSYLRVTRTAYDTVAVNYAELLRGDLATKPLDRGLLGVFAELVRADGDRPVADLGCGPGRVTTYLSSLGLNAFGVDLSPAMVAVARQAHPGLRFDEGSMADLDVADSTLGGIVAWYSIIHTPPELLPSVFAEFHRVLAPGGHLLLAFQVGDERVHLQQGFGHEMSLDAFRLLPDRITDLLDDSRLCVDARVVREPIRPEKTQHAYLLGRKVMPDPKTPCAASEQDSPRGEVTP